MSREFTAAEVDDADREALEDAREDELLLEHAHETSWPWYLCDILFRPRLAVVRWTRDTYDRLRDRMTGIMTFVWLTGVVATIASPRFAQWWKNPATVIFWIVAGYFINLIVLTIAAKAYDVAGRQLGAPENFDRLRVVLALSWIPIILVQLPIGLLRLMFREVDTSKTDFNFTPQGFEWFFGGVSLVWSIVFTCRAIKTVQRFSPARAAANQLLGATYLTLLVVITALAVGGGILLTTGKLTIPQFLMDLV